MAGLATEGGVGLSTLLYVVCALIHEGWKDLILGSGVNLHLPDSTDVFPSHVDPVTHSFAQGFAYKCKLALS